MGGDAVAFGDLFQTGAFRFFAEPGQKNPHTQGAQLLGNHERCSRPSCVDSGLPMHMRGMTYGASGVHPGILNERQRALLPVLAAILPCRWNSLGIAVRAQAFTCFY